MAPQHHYPPARFPINRTADPEDQYEIMVRGIHKRKPSRSLARPAGKRRKIGRSRRRKTSSALSSRQLNASNPFAFRSKKVSKKRWRSMLWRDTAAKQHFRSIVNSNPALSTPTGVTSLNFAIASCFSSLNTTLFWRTAGGFQDSGFGSRPAWQAAPGVGVPEAVQLIIRGGMIWISIANPSLSDTIQCRVQLAWTKSQQRNTTDTAVSNTFNDYATAIVASNPRPIGWDVTSAPDYSEYLHQPVMDKSMTLKPGDDCMFAHRLKPVMLDADEFTREAGWFPYWMVYLGQKVDGNALAQAMTVTLGHNLSFCMMDTTDQA